MHCRYALRWSHGERVVRSMSGKLCIGNAVAMEILLLIFMEIQKKSTAVFAVAEMTHQSSFALAEYATNCGIDNIICFVSFPASHSVLAYATVRGLIYGWDLRAPKTIWKLQNDPALGKFCVTLEYRYPTHRPGSKWDKMKLNMPIISVAVIPFYFMSCSLQASTLSCERKK